MRTLIAAVLAVGIAMPALAETAIHRQGDDWVRLQDTKCSHGETLARLKEEWRDQFKNARAQVGKEMFYGCWLAKPDGTIFILFEDGEGAELPITSFQSDGI